MSSRFVLANLFHYEDRQLSLSFEHVTTSTSWQDHGPGSTIGFYNLCNGRIEADRSSPTYLKHCKAMEKARIASMILTQLLNGNTTVGGNMEDEPRQGDKGLPSASMGNTLVVADEAFVNCGAIHTHSRNLFFSTNFTFPIITSNETKHHLASVQHLHVSSPTLKLDRVCIFNDHLVKTSLPHAGSSKVNASHLSLAPATINELEYIARWSSTIADMAVMFISRRGKERSGPTISIGLDIPSWHYHPSVVQAYERGHCNATEALRSMDAVNRRHDQISYVFTSAIQHELRKRGANSGDYDIHSSDKTNPVAAAIRQGLQIGKLPSLEDFVQGLSLQNNHPWGDFCTLIPEREQPQDLDGLVYLFYVFEAVKSALTKAIAKHHSTFSQGRPEAAAPSTPKGSRIGTKPSRLILSVDDPAERRIYTRAQQVLRKLRSSRKDLPSPVLVETYMCRRVFVNGNKTRARLYRQDTTPQPIALLTSPKISNDADNARMVGPLDVVRELYGYECAYNLQMWLMDVGLPSH
ncbi:hypothetical protein EPUS_09296 [Endocarpon pusillum Z07020]|uniref:Uncharacterized protein n=1 Tax=Endocarpon pusillum (strain Z07020 / HMAS-L-300199) TaxID=1263415 RepID=U1G274_ENDPU|nr:uncharacterized protein EPUS_09296 [Endocarpon pusillum Z07020]ERF71372.1 hypothetical protein EPUS_09296 [Endocarpon pusillum Z07020]